MKTKVLFVGSFKETSKDGSVGGQMYASKSLINSSLTEVVEWTLIDTTSDSNIRASTFVRFRKALKRSFRFVYYIIFFRFDSVLIFVANGLSFWEKGFMSICAKYLSRSKVILAPRSGFIINDLEKTRMRKYILYVFKKVDVVICQSLYWQKMFSALLPESKFDKFIVIENLIDFKIYEGLRIKLPEVKSTNILFMAWISEKKGIFELLEAIQLLRIDKLPFKLIIAGKGVDYIKVKKRVKELNFSDYVEFKDWVLGDAKLRLLEEADIFVLPTYFDGYPNSLLEAMASGTACVGTHVGSIDDMIEHCKNGILIDSKSHLQLYKALKYLILHPDKRLEMAINARETVKITNSPQIILEKYKTILIDK